MPGPIRLGVVTAYDAPRGLGSVSDETGGSWAFHCTRIADGSRQIEVGARVAFTLAAGHLGKMEAASLTKLQG